MRDVLCPAFRHLDPVLEDIPSGAKQNQEKARYHSSASARTKRHPQARHEKVVNSLFLVSYVTRPGCFFSSLPLSFSLSSFTSRTIIERVPVHGCDKLEGREERQRAKPLEVNLATTSD